MHTFSQGMTNLYASGQLGAERFQSVDVPEYAFNDAIYILVEHGMAGLLLWLGIVCVVCRALWHRSKPSLYALLSLLAFSMFSYPMELMPFKILLVLFMAWATAETRNHTATAATKSRGTISCLLLLLAGVAVAHTVSQRAATDNHINDLKTMPQPHLLKDYYAFMETETDDANYMFCFGKALSSLKRYSDSNAILRKGTLVSADPMFYVVMGNNYRNTGMPLQAEWCYKRAFAMMPNRLYPLYKLAQLYHDTGQTDEMRRICKRVMHFRPKIESRATNEMKAEATQMLR